MNQKPAGYQVDVSAWQARRKRKKAHRRGGLAVYLDFEEKHFRKLYASGRANGGAGVWGYLFGAIINVSTRKMSKFGGGPK